MSTTHTPAPSRSRAPAGRLARPAGAVRLAISTALFLALASVAAAHDFYIQPSSFTPAPGEPLALELLVGDPGESDRFPWSPDHALRFELVGLHDRVTLTGRPGATPAASLQPTDTGPRVVGYRSSRSFIELDGTDFTDYLHEEGLDAIVAERQAAGTTDEIAREVYSRCAKSLLAGSSASRLELFARPLGFTLEIVPEVDPFALAEDASGALQPFVARVLFLGEPLAGTYLHAHSLDEPQVHVAARTRADGRVSLQLPRDGAWLLAATHMVTADALPDGDGIRFSARWAHAPEHDYESIWTSLTFEARAAPDTVVDREPGSDGP